MLEENYTPERVNELENGQRPREKKKKSHSFLYGLLCGIWLSIVLYAAGSLLGWVVGYFRAEDKKTAFSDDEKEQTESIVDSGLTRKLESIESVIGRYYLEDADQEALEDGIYAGMIASLGDPYSAYYSAEDLEEMEQEVEGIYYGIGAYVGIDAATSLPVIAGVIEDTPAQEADLRDGDLIYMVDGTSTQGMTTEDVVALIRGEENTVVHLTLVRSGESDYVEVDVTRRKVESPTVTYEMMEGDIGYIQITEFDTVTVDQFTEALAVCKGSDMKGLILDLRSNPGGSLAAVCEIARKLLPEGLIVYTEDKYGQRDEFTCDGKNEIQVPMVVLINGYSASASEILAGAIQDYDKGTIMGTQSYGKGIVQRVIGLSDGSAVKLTISTYYTPNGNDIHGIGVTPDEVVEYDAERYYEEEVDNQIEAALEHLKKEIAE